MIQDNILIAREGFHHLKTHKMGGSLDMAVKMDFNKAYDRVQLDFLQCVMRMMGFNDQWYQWVMECITTVTFLVFANREKRTTFKPSRGVRQGDPLSP
ncbi:unnamed protein product [Camellia sinensis]